MSDSLDGVFSALGNETRIEILRALGEAGGRDSFTALKERVGLADSGRFNYHLDRLRGRYVEKTDDGYVMTREGLRVTGAVVASAPRSAEPVGPEPAPVDCIVCGADQTIRYEDSAVRLQCSAREDHGWLSPLPPGALDHHDLEELLALGTSLNRCYGRFAREGTCPQCFGRTERELQPSDTVPADVGGHEYMFRSKCGSCGFPFGGSVGALVTDHPAVVSAYYEHGVDVREEVYLPHERRPPAVVSENPLRLRVDVPHPDAALADGPNDDRVLVSLELDDTPEVVAVERHD